VLTFLVCSVGTLTAYHNHPLSMDEYAPLFQSKVFAAGRLNGSLPPEMLDWLIPPGFQKIFLLVSKATGDVASAYWPAYALLLTPFTLAGIPWALNPLLSALTVLVLHRIGLMIFGNQQSAGLVVLFTIASPVFVADGISYYSMTAHLLMNAVYMLLLLQPTPKRLFAAGLVGSIALTLHNPYPHLLFAIPWLVWIAHSEKGFVRLLQIGAGYLPLSLLLGLGWYWFLGELTHRGINGSETANMSARVASAFTLPDTAILVARLAGFAKVWLWTVPGLVVLACFGAWRWRTNAPLRLLWISAVLTYLGYFLVVPDQGHGWGFRYFHSAWLALPLLGAAALTARHGTSADRAEEPHAPSSGIQAFAAYCVFGSLLFAVGLRVYQINDFMSDHLAQLPSAPVSAPKVVIIDPSRSFYGVDLVQNDPFLRDGVINLLSHGTRANEAMMAKFRPSYRRLFADPPGEVWVAPQMVP
jgi:hypothetical protein